MANRKLIAGLDIGTSWVRLVVCEQKPNDSTPQIIALVKKPSRGLRRGYIINPEETTAVIKDTILDAERSLKTKLKKVFLGMGGVSLDSRIVEASIISPRGESEITSNDIARALDVAEANIPEMTNRRVLHRLAIDYKIDGEKVLGQPIGLKGTRLEVKVLFITALHQHLKDLVQVTESAGLIVDDVIASPLASSLASVTKNQKLSGCALLDIGSQTTSLAIFEEGRPISLQVFPLGSNDVTNDIALGFRITPEEAERVKKGEGEPVGTKKKLDEIVEARLSDIFEFAERHLKKLGVAGLLPSGLALIGGGSGTPEIEEMARSYFKLPAKLASANIATASRSQIRDSAWATAYGLCLYNDEPQANTGNLLNLSSKITHQIGSWLKEFMP